MYQLSANPHLNGRNEFRLSDPSKLSIVIIAIFLGIFNVNFFFYWFLASLADNPNNPSING
jgi:hypothetical protein